MKRLLIAILFVLVTVSGFCAGTTTIKTGAAVTSLAGDPSQDFQGAIATFSNMALASPCHFFAYFSATQAIPNGVATNASYTAELYDTHTAITLGTFVCPNKQGGIYLINAMTQYPAGDANAGCSQTIKKNGNAIGSANGVLSVAGYTTLSTSEYVVLAPGDTLRVILYQVASAPLSLVADGSTPYSYFCGVRLF